MKRIVIAMSAFALVMGAGGILSQEAALADEANVEASYKPPKHEPEINETENVKKITRSKRKRAMKAKIRRLRKGNTARSGGYRGARCSNAHCR